LDPEREPGAVAVALDRLDRAVRAQATGRRPAPTRATAWWWREFSQAHARPMTRRSIDPSAMRTVCVGLAMGPG
jgi:hypothetical protein